MHIEVAVAKVNKYATRESGDTLEMVERPGGGLSFVLADGQGSGAGAKAISHLVARKAVSLLAEGVRDGAAARAAHDFLYALRGGKVSADLTIVSVDMTSQTIVLSRNSGVPVFFGDAGGIRALDEPSQPVGIYQWTKPAIAEIPIAAGTHIVVLTDGVVEGGLRYGHALDVAACLAQSLAHCPASAQSIADEILTNAIRADRGRPADDMSVLVLSVLPEESPDGVRRMTVCFPI
jgi:serine phosphatase RsbU (regulator of sigma subunit)